jgi:hypothetical protein
VWIDFSNLYYEDEWAKYVLRIIHAKFMWLDMPHMINKDAIRDINGLCSTRPFLALNYINNEMVMKLTRSNFDKCALIVNDIEDPTIKYASMVIDYRILYAKRDKFISTTIIHKKIPDGEGRSRH